jgi:ubiquinone/menaquinone biosynthesis C-methylase UbiE
MSTDSLKLIFNEEGVHLAYVEQDGNIFIVSSGPDTRWPSRVLREGRATFELAGRIETRGAILVSDQLEKSKILNLFRLKYGDKKVNEWFSNHSRFIKLNGEPSPVGDSQSHYYEWLENEFDSIADEYDTHIFGNQINSLLRERSLDILTSYFFKPSILLEIGCGTGTETMELLRKGHTVVAIDISEKMLDILSSKVRKENLDQRFMAIKLNAQNIQRMEEKFGRQYFDGIYSTYGAMNCISDLRPIPPSLRRLIKDDGKLVMGIYNRLCASEVVGYSAKFRISNAINRLKRNVREGESRFCVDIYSYTLPEFVSIFKPFFRSIHTEGVPVVILPSNFVKYTKMFDRKFDTLKSFDSWLGRRWPFNMLGDHFLVVMEPRPLT